MKLLFDQNLPPSLPSRLADIYPDSTHVRDIGFGEATDTEIWDYAKQNGFAIVSKDSDFQQKSLLYGSPPKVIWIRVGNGSVKQINDLLRSRSILIHTFNLNDVESLLILP
jgi:predicted nuclease of predicted toxin-antitoxin system